MRFINTTTLKLEEFFGSDIPEYAWEDTCCIDKKSSAELTESINSMFQWYQDAKECFVFLSDLKSGPNVAERLKTCRWFTRGWTLQELIAPKRVRFYDDNWDYVAKRMSWAAHRQATRVEDRAYCLLGLFDVNMPMLYGEGMRAFGRLQEEIIKRSNDMKIFAWIQPEGQPEVASGALFAPSPTYFAQSCDVNGFGRRYSDLEFALTNKGLRIDKCVHFYEVTSERNGNEPHVTGFALPLGYRQTTGPSPEDYDIVLNLWKIGPNSFLRESVSGLVGKFNPAPTPALSFYITATTNDLRRIKHAKMRGAVKFPLSETIQVQNTIPHSHWDHARQLFFAPTENRDLVLAASVKIVLAAQIETKIIICLDFNIYGRDLRKPPRCLIFNENTHTAVSRWLFRHKRLGYNGHDATWSDVREEMEETLGFSERLRLSVGESNFHVQASLINRVIESISTKPIYSLELVVEKVHSYTAAATMP